MSCYKADSRYTQRYDDIHYHSTDSDESDVPEELVLVRRKWLEQNMDAIEEAYFHYIEIGEMLFGRAFHQLGGIDDFAVFVFKYMQPGAIKSNQALDNSTCLHGLSGSD